MSADFSFPEGWASAPAPPPPPPAPSSPVDPHRIESLANRFIAASHGVLHGAPDAFFARAGAHALDGAPAVAARLSHLRDATLELARDEAERRALAGRLAPYHELALADVDRHVAAQQGVFARQAIAERQALTLQAAGLAHNEDALPGLAEAHATAARALARLEGRPEAPAMQAARSTLWRHAIDQRLAAGQGERALGLFARARADLLPADRRALALPIEAARTDAAAGAWLAREEARPGAPLAARLEADSGLGPAEKATALARLEARDSARESARVAAVRGLDDTLEATSHALATQPGRYTPGTLAALSSAYADAGEPARADALGRLARQESFLLSFSRSGAAAQRRLVDTLPEGEARAAADAIRERQADAFARDAFAAGTALYPEVGPARPIDDVAGRIVQARTIAAYRGIPVAPFTAGEIATMSRQLADGSPQERAAVRARVDALPEDVRPVLVADNVGDGAQRV